MYNFLKKNIKALIPKQVLFKNELFFRSFHGLFFIGNKNQCNVCSKKLRTFITLKNNDLLCPFCGSLSRHRRLLKLLEENNAIQGHVLHFSPSRNLFRKLKSLKNINYFSSDFEGEFLADYNYDITNIKQKGSLFDTVICYHILEHIDEDTKAIKELYRVLKPNGRIYMQTPFKEGDIYENNNITSPKDREQHFGQEDHVRIYAAKGLSNRLEKIGFNVKLKIFELHKNDFYNGLKSPETVLIVNK